MSKTRRASVKEFERKVRDSVVATKAMQNKQRKTLRNSLDGMSRFEEGDSVQVIKQGSNYGKLASVVDPDWHGRVQVSMSGTDSGLPMNSGSTQHAPAICRQTAPQCRKSSAVGAIPVVYSSS